MLFCAQVKNDTKGNAFFVPEAKMIETVMLFCAQVKNDTNCNDVFVPESKT